MTADRVSALAGQDAWAASRVAPEGAPEDTRTHQDELNVAHGCVPSAAWSDVHAGAGTPAPDPGPPIGTVI